jgi:hypothetical protein
MIAGDDYLIYCSQFIEIIDSQNGEEGEQI